jgi:hypothetical protein
VDLESHGVDFGLAEVGEEEPVAPHERVGDGHELAEHLLRRLVDADGVVERLRHFLDAVEALEDFCHEDDLRRLAGVALEVAAHEEIEFLIGAAELDVALEHDGVVALHDGVEEFVDADGLLGLEALVEVFALEHLGDGGLGGEADQICVTELVEPLGVEADLGERAIEDAEDLLGVGLGVA